jgi:hypothetical protein
MNIDLNAFGAGIAALFMGAVGYIGGRGKRKATEATDIADQNAERAVLDANGALYNRLKERLDLLEAEVTRVRAELDVERRHGRKLENHIWTLRGLMREAGITPPPFDELELPGQNGVIGG